MLRRCRRRWDNSKPTLGQRLVLLSFIQRVLPFNTNWIVFIKTLKHITTLFFLADHNIAVLLLMIKYRPIIMVGLWYYNQSGVTELLIMRDPHYDCSS